MVSEKSGIDAEKARLLRRDAEWVLAASEGRDIERILSFWTDDAVVLPPDRARQSITRRTAAAPHETVIYV